MNVIQAYCVLRTCTGATNKSKAGLTTAVYRGQQRHLLLFKIVPNVYSLGVTNCCCLLSCLAPVVCQKKFPELLNQFLWSFWCLFWSGKFWIRKVFQPLLAISYPVICFHFTWVMMSTPSLSLDLMLNAYPNAPTPPKRLRIRDSSFACCNELTVLLLLIIMSSWTSQ